MKSLLKNGTIPSVNNATLALLEEGNFSAEVTGDEIDLLISNQNLCISALAFFRHLDLMLVVLNNRTVLSRRLSAYVFLENASDEFLNNYQLQFSGVHWPDLDADLSLRGFVMEEMIKSITSNSQFAA
jgi:hypothetical protein